MPSKKRKCIITMEYIKAFAPLVTLIVTVVIFLITRSISTNLNKLNYSPQVVFTDCKITGFQIIKGSPNTYIVTAETKIKNIGNSNAHLIVTNCAILSTGEDSLRHTKYAKDFSKEIKDADRSYYSDRQIYPGQELNGPTLYNDINEAELATGIGSISLKDELLTTDSTFTLHFWIVYSNDNDVFYDTYFWYTAKITDDTWKFVGQSYSFNIFGNKEKRKMKRDAKNSESLTRSYISF